jgi:hypothetical protein
MEQWRAGGEDTLVKVFPKGTRPSNSDEVMAGYCTSVKFLAGRTPAEMERILGFKAGTKLKDGAEIFRVDPLPSADQFELRGYTQLPDGVPQRNGKVVDERYPPGLGAPQWDLKGYPQSGLKWLATVQSDQPFLCRYSNLPTGLAAFVAGGKAR